MYGALFFKVMSFSPLVGGFLFVYLHLGVESNVLVLSLILVLIENKT